MSCLASDRVGKLVVLALFAMLTACETSAKAASGDNGFKCKYDGNQQEMNACAFRDFKTADRLLDRKFREVMAPLPPAGQQSLRRQQHTWLKDRESRCKAEAKPSEGGSVWSLDYFGCLKSATERRAKELGRWVAKK